MFKLDYIDKNLLEILDKNARESVTSISHKLNISKQVASFRLNRLQKNGVILEYSTYIDRAKLGYQHHQLYLDLVGYDFEKLKADLLELENVHWSATLEGQFNLAIYFLTKTQADCYFTIRSILQKFSGHIKFKEYLVTSRSDYFNQSAITYVERKLMMTQADKKKPRLKENDFKLVNLIKTDARKTLAQLSKVIGSSTRTVKDRLRYLRKVGVIKNFRARLNYTKLGFDHYQIFFETNNISETERLAIRSLLLNCPECIRLTETLGKWEICSDIVIPQRSSIQNWLAKNISRKKLANVNISYIQIKDVLKINTLVYL